MIFADEDHGPCVSITIPMEAIGQPRPRAFAKGKHASVYEPQHATDWKKQARLFVAQAAENFPEEYVEKVIKNPGPIGIDMLVVFALPKSKYRKRIPRKRGWHTKKPDPDNIEKIVFDALSGIAYLDDSQISRHTTIKVVGAQGELPQIFIRLQSLGGYDGFV